MYRLILIFVFYYSIINDAFAGNSIGQVNAYWNVGPNVFLFTLAVNKQNQPSCDSAYANGTGRYAVSTKTQLGKDVQNSIMNAKNFNLTISALGLGTCTTWRDSEDLKFIEVYKK